MKKLLIFLTFVLGITAIMAFLISDSRDEMERLDLEAQFDENDF